MCLGYVQFFPIDQIHQCVYVFNVIADPKLSSTRVADRRTKALRHGQPDPAFRAI
jgi:hypothetical protein